MTPVLLLLLATLASSPRQQTAARIEGVALNSAGGAPIARVRILLFRQSAGGNGEYATLTGSDGRFIIKDVTPGQYRLTAKLAGFVDSEYGAKRAKGMGSPIDLASGQTLRDVAIRMTAGAVISGRIYDDVGQPMAEANVQLLQSRYDSEGRFLGTAVANVRTDDLGEYRIFWIAPGSYYLSAAATTRDLQMPPQYRNAVVNEQYDGVEEGFLPIFYPNAFDSANAIPIQVESGVEVRGIDLVLRRFPTVRVRGQVLDGTTGEAASNIEVWLRRKQDGWTDLAATVTAAASPKGEFDLRRVVPGPYTLGASLSRPTPGSRMVSSETEIQVGDKDITDLRVLLQPMPSLQGRVLFEQGTPERPMTLRWNSLSGDVNSRGGVGVADDGNFSQTLRPGRYRVALSAPEGYFIRSARSGSRNILRDGIETAGESPQPLEISVAYSTAVVEGHVTDDRDNAGAGVEVVLIPDVDRLMRANLFRNVTTDQLGRFSLHGVAPGDYKIFAWEDIEPYSYFDPVFVELYESRAVPVHVEQSGSVTVDLKSLP